MFASTAIAIGSASGIITAGVSGIAACGGAGPVAALVVAIIVAIIVPFLYFMLKPAFVLSFIINNTNEKLNWIGSHNVHGKTTGWTSSIPSKVEIKQKDGSTVTYNSMGLLMGEKNKNALVGCQLGFTYQIGSSNNKIAYGSESPLTSLYVDNNVWTEFNISAEDVANKTDSENKLNSTATSEGMTSTIRCAKSSGDGAYSVAVLSD